VCCLDVTATTCKNLSDSILLAPVANAINDSFLWSQNRRKDPEAGIPAVGLGSVGKGRREQGRQGGLCLGIASGVDYLGLRRGKRAR
jgi:hypothetical protein